MNDESFTMIELIMVIVIVGVLTAVALPKFVNFRQDAKRAAETADARSVRSGLLGYYSESAVRNRMPPYPPALDDAPDGSYSSVSNPFFVRVLTEPGVKSAGWYKVDNGTYRGESGLVYTYDNVNGVFSEGK